MFLSLLGAVIAVPDRAADTDGAADRGSDALRVPRFKRSVPDANRQCRIDPGGDALGDAGRLVGFDLALDQVDGDAGFAVDPGDQLEIARPAHRDRMFAGFTRGSFERPVGRHLAQQGIDVAPAFGLDQLLEVALPVRLDVLDQCLRELRHVGAEDAETGLVAAGRGLEIKGRRTDLGRRRADQVRQRVVLRRLLGHPQIAGAAVVGLAFHGVNAGHLDARGMRRTSHAAAAAQCHMELAAGATPGLLGVARGLPGAGQRAAFDAGLGMIHLPGRRASPIVLRTGPAGTASDRREIGLLAGATEFLGLAHILGGYDLAGLLTDAAAAARAG